MNHGLNGLVHMVMYVLSSNSRLSASSLLALDTLGRAHISCPFLLKALLHMVCIAVLVRLVLDVKFPVVMLLR